MRIGVRADPTAAGTEENARLPAALVARLQRFLRTRSDPTFNRIARHIQNAVQQFDVVNQQREHPNILVFVNHADGSHAGDLHEVLTGHFRADSGDVHPTMLNISEGRLGRIKGRIDLYIWIDRDTKVRGWFFSESDPGHMARLKELFRPLLRKRNRCMDEVA